MSWLTKRVQTGRLRGKNRSKQGQTTRRRLRARVGGKTKARFLSATIKPMNGKGGIKGKATINFPCADDRAEAR